MTENGSDTPLTDPSEQLEEDIQRAIDKLEGRDVVGTAGEVLGTAAGAAAGAAAAGAIAGAAGATTLLGSSLLGSIAGGVFVAATPVGWVVGCAMVGGAAAYGISRLVHSGGEQDKERENMRDRLKKRLQEVRRRGKGKAAVEELDCVLALALEKGAISSERADQIRSLVARGGLTAELAVKRVGALVGE